MLHLLKHVKLENSQSNFLHVLDPQHPSVYNTVKTLQSRVGIYHNKLEEK